MIIICTAKIANTTVGHIDHALAYAAGWQRLGHEVYLMEQVGPKRCVDDKGEKVPFEHWHGRRHFEQVAKAYGLWPRSCLFFKKGEASHGMAFSEAVRIAKQCDLLITRSGQIHKAPDIFENARCRAYFDGNPGSTQFQFHQRGGDFEALDRYEYRFTLGLNVGTPLCPIPTGDYRWHRAMRPVVLSMWPLRQHPPTRGFTTISSWKGRASFNWGGRYSGEKSDNWLQFLDLPQQVPATPLEIALRITAGDAQAERARFRKKGWCISDAGELRRLDDYREFIACSKAEFSVAHNRYVEFNTGWFSDRSALYLACGRPVLVQSTGIEHHLPTGRGLLTFSTPDEAVDGIGRIERDYPLHCRAAREIAEQYFDSDKVLRAILERIGG
jgi:hypothetical protein